MAGITARSKARGIGFLACMLFLLGIFTLYLDSFEKIKKTITVESIEKSKEEDTLIGGKLDITGYEDGNPVIGTTVEIEEQVKINQGLRGWSTHIFIILAVGANCVAADRLKRTGRYGGETRTSEGYLASAFAFFFVLIWMKILSFFGFALTYVSTFIIMCYGILAYLGSIINILEDLHSERGASSSHLFFQSNDEKTTMMMMICFVPLVMYSIWTKPYLQHISLIQSNATGINDAKDESMFSFMFSFMEFSFADINRECIVALAIGCNLLTAKLNKNQSRELKQFLEHWEVVTLLMSFFSIASFIGWRFAEWGLVTVHFEQGIWIFSLIGTLSFLTLIVSLLLCINFLYSVSLGQTYSIPLILGVERKTQQQLHQD